MESPSHITSLDRLHDGLMLYFRDGKQGFFPDELLYKMLESGEVSHRVPYLDFDRTERS